MAPTDWTLWQRHGPRDRVLADPTDGGSVVKRHDGAVTSQPTEPPTSGPAVEVAPHGEKVRPKTTVFPRASRTLWVYWPDRWQAADVRARQDWPTGATSYQVELNTWDDNGQPHRVTRSFLWGRDSVRPA